MGFPCRKVTKFRATEQRLGVNEATEPWQSILESRCIAWLWFYWGEVNNDRERKREIPFAAYKVTNINHCVRNLSKLCMNLCACVTKKVYAFKGSNFKDCSTTFVKIKNKKDFKDCVLCVFLCNMCMGIFFPFSFFK